MTLALSSYDGKIPTALILAGPNIASHTPLFEQLASRIRDEDRTGPVIVLTSKDATNLKSTLKKLIKDATQQDEGLDDEDDEVVIGRKGARLLNYDLQILQNWCKIHEGQKVVIAIQDTEAFDGNILSDLISLFKFVHNFPQLVDMPPSDEYILIWDLVHTWTVSLLFFSWELQHLWKFSTRNFQNLQFVLCREINLMLSVPRNASRKSSMIQWLAINQY